MPVLPMHGSSGALILAGVGLITGACVTAGSSDVTAATTPGASARPSVVAAPTCPSAPDAPGLAVYDSTDAVIPAKVGPGVRFPRYPDALRRRGIKGQVLARMTIQTDGCVDPASIEIVQATDSLFGAAVRRALEGSRFMPAIRDGVTVRYRLLRPFTFDIRP